MQKEGKDEKKENKGEKKAENNNNNKGEAKKGGDGPITVVLKIDIHCEGCALKIKKSVKNFEGSVFQTKVSIFFNFRIRIEFAEFLLEFFSPNRG